MQFKIFEPSDPKAVRYILNPTQNNDERLRIACCRRRRNGRDVGCTLAQTWCHDKEKKDLRVQDDIMQGDDVPMWNQANMVPLSILTAGMLFLHRYLFPTTDLRCWPMTNACI